MQHFHNILFVSHATGNETEPLKQAFSIARNNNASLKVLVVCPEFPANMAKYREKYTASLTEQATASIAAARSALKLEESDVSATVAVESGSTPSIRIIRHVLRDAHDLVVKEAELQEDGKGFKAMDMELLRKCPCPVWLCRPITHSRTDIRVAVAIDPETEEQAAHDLGLRLLTLSRSLADECSGELHILSCWDYEYEEYLRHNAWIKIPDEELLKTVTDTQVKHRGALEALIQESGIIGKMQIHHVRGQADEQIPRLVEDRNVDILVMGTVGRTGVAGFIIGNTAENVLQKISCSLLALKPNGFVSPVKAY